MASEAEDTTTDGHLPTSENLETAPRLRPGATLGDYVLKSEISTTPGKASVWRARNTAADRTEVLKIYLLADKEHSFRIADESKLAERWSSYPTVVTTYFVGAIDSFWVIAMEEMAKTLSAHIAEREADPSLARDSATYADWIAHVGAALCTIHEAGDLHRDVTGNNVMLDKTETVAKLMDFSVGRPRREPGEEKTGQGLVGTLRFLAPEQHDGDHSPESDQYQLGALAWMLFSGAAVGRDPDKKLTNAVRSVLERATSQRPANRFPNVPSFTVALQVATQGSTARLATFLRYPPPPLRRLIARLPTVAAMVPCINYTVYGLAPGTSEFGQAVGIGVISAVLIVISIAGEFALLFVTKAQQDDRRGVGVVLPLYAGVLLAFAASAFVVASGPPLGAPLIVGPLPAMAYTLGVLVYALGMGAVSRHEGRFVIAYGETLLGLRGRQRRWAFVAVSLVAAATVTWASIAYVSDRRTEAAERDQAGSAKFVPPQPERRPLSIDPARSGPSEEFVKAHPEMTLQLGRDGSVSGIGGVLVLGRSPDVGLFESTFGRPAVRNGEVTICTLRWPKVGLEVNAANFSGADACRRRIGLIQSFEVHNVDGVRWGASSGVKVGSNVAALRELYPNVRIGRFTRQVPLELKESPFGDSGFTESLGAKLVNGKVIALVASIGAAGD